MGFVKMTCSGPWLERFVYNKVFGAIIEGMKIRKCLNIDKTTKDRAEGVTHVFK